MRIEMFNGWYFFALALSIGSTVILYHYLKRKTEKTQKRILFAILVFALILHFVKFLFPPYSMDEARLLRDSWFINICGANICLFPFLFWSKKDWVKDYMFYLGILGGFIAVVYPMEPLDKVNQEKEILDIIRFYVHHTILWSVPVLMAKLGIHKPSFKRVWSAPSGLMLLMLFIMLNQIFQSELGFVPLRGNDIFAIGYKNTSYIWGPDDAIGDFIANFCPKIFTIIPVGPHAGEEKYWPLIWLVVPAFLILTPIAFLMSLIFDHEAFSKHVLKTYRKYKRYKPFGMSIGLVELEITLKEQFYMLATENSELEKEENENVYI